ncbi:MAG: glucodextranase DOMON-like domain-containing protein, partial [Anaerolineaceae bacterium]
AGGDGWHPLDQQTAGNAAAGGKVLEAAIPLSMFGKLSSGDDLRLAVVAQPTNQVVPQAGPAQVVLSALDTSTTVFEVLDPEDDDHGPGTYTYPTDGVFKDDKSYDLKSFRVSVDDSSVLFKFAFYGSVPNPWGSPNGLAIQTLDVYVDKDPGAGTGARMLFPGRNAALEQGSGWDVGIWAEGWTPKVVKPDAATLEPKPDTEASFKVVVDASAQTVTLIVPKEVFGEGDPATWGYVAAVLGQEGYPNPPEVWRVRNIASSSAQWSFGGSPADANHTRIIDLIWPADAAVTQETMLSTYTGNNKPMAELTADDVAQLKELNVK